MNDASTILWRGMTRAQLDVAYNNSLAVPDGDKRRDGLDRAQHRNAQEQPGAARLGLWAARAQPPRRVPLRQNPRAAVRTDSRRLTGSAITRTCSPAWPRARCRKGFDVAVIGYTLCPEVTLTELVAETHAAIRWLRQEGSAPRRWRR